MTYIDHFHISRVLYELVQGQSSAADRFSQNRCSWGTFQTPLEYKRKSTIKVWLLLDLSQRSFTTCVDSQKWSNENLSQLERTCYQWRQWILSFNTLDHICSPRDGVRHVDHLSHLCLNPPLLCSRLKTSPCQLPARPTKVKKLRQNIFSKNYLSALLVFQWLGLTRFYPDQALRGSLGLRSD